MSDNKKLFDFCIGNPPYNDDFENSGENGNYAKPVYNVFMDAADEVSEKVELIHPGRFLFNAGSTPKQWNEKMLNDVHFKVLKYNANSSAAFPNTDIKGGIAVTYRDDDKNFGSIGTFTVFPELTSIKAKAGANGDNSFSNLIYAPESYKFTEKMHSDHPEVASLLSKGHRYDFKSIVIEKLNNIVFFDSKPDDGFEYIRILGGSKGKRVMRWIRRDYVKPANNFNKYKVFVPEANGTGAIGEILSTPLIGEPLIGHTQTFISIGNFDDKDEAEACLKYVKTKFVRVLLGIKKVTQHNPKATWEYVPLQDFTNNSDIDWSESIPEIDQQLYKKYGLSDDEINFIETHVKEMK